MSIKTLLRANPAQDATVRLIQRDGSSLPFAVIVDLPAHYATFHPLSTYDVARELYDYSISRFAEAVESLAS